MVRLQKGLPGDPSLAENAPQRAALVRPAVRNRHRGDAPVAIDPSKSDMLRFPGEFKPESAECCKHPLFGGVAWESRHPL